MWLPQVARAVVRWSEPPMGLDSSQGSSTNWLWMKGCSSSLGDTRNFSYGITSIFLNLLSLLYETNLICMDLFPLVGFFWGKGSERWCRIRCSRLCGFAQLSPMVLVGSASLEVGVLLYLSLHFLCSGQWITNAVPMAAFQSYCERKIPSEWKLFSSGCYGNGELSDCID